MKKIVVLLYLTLIALTTCLSQTPKLIVSGIDTFGVVPSALETNINRTYIAAHKFRDLYILESMANDSMRTALNERGLALNDCDSAKVLYIKIEANDQKEIGSLKKQNSKFQKANYIFKAATIVLATTVYVMALKR